MEEIQAESISSALADHKNTKFPSIATPQKYVSMFRIDDVPILPPLMTQEKRRQMQKLKEKAVKVEQRLKESRRRQQKCNLEFGTVVEEFNQDEGALENNNDSSSSSCVSENILDQYDQREEAEKSYILLSDIIIQNEIETKSVISKHNFGKLKRPTASEAIDFGSEIGEPQSSETNLMQRMQNLRKSETLIYDHRSNTLLSPLSEDEVQLFQQQQQQINLNQPEEKTIGCKVGIREVEESANLNKLTQDQSNPKYAHKGLKKIPSICIDPPTPITSSRTFNEAITPKISIDTINLNNRENSNKEQKKSVNEEQSSDNSFKCMGSTTNLEKDLKAHRKVTNITNKILKFENYYVSDTREDTPKCSNIKPPQRSATSPSLKAATSERSNPTNISLDVSHGSQNENGLVRSNSFTLDCPSKALIEHIRQRKVSTNDNYPTKRSNLFSMTYSRETVESKAKRVQKVDMKTRSGTTRLQLKPSTTNITSPSSSHSTSNKVKRSPYEQKVIKPKITRQLKKSVSGTTAIKQMKPRPSMPSIQSAKTPTDRTPGNLHFNGIEAEHRQKFLELLAHQKREQQRMQQVFEEQQQYLLEQLTAEVGSARISNKNAGDNVHSSVLNSPAVRSDYVESVSSQSPTMTANSSVVFNSLDLMSGASELPSPDLSACSSIMPTTSQSSNRGTPRRRLFPRDLSPSASMGSKNGGGSAHNIGRSNGATPEASNLRRKIQHNESFHDTKERDDAVTKINAHVRGYLVRRLFQTEQIQRIVQTAKDTLIFVLSIHMETIRDPVDAVANIKLKARLLNQLTSAIRTLHLILFQTSVKERMEIISRDRERIKTRMLTLSMKRSPRFQI